MTWALVAVAVVSMIEFAIIVRMRAKTKEKDARLYGQGFMHGLEEGTNLGLEAEDADQPT